MPFTLSHPAAVLPIRRLGVLSALVIGSMMPDSLYFMPFGSPHESYGHTLPGLFYYCVPAGLFFLWIFHAFLKLPLIALFPAKQQGKLLAVSRDFSFGPSSRFLLLASSVLLGAASHVTWDAFTHLNGWGAQLFPVLRKPLIISHSVFFVAEFMQVGSSIFGLAVLGFYYWRWQKEAAGLPVRVHLHAAVRGFLLVLFCAGALAPSIARFAFAPEFWINFKRLWIGRAAVDAIKVGCVELLVFAVIWHIAVGSHQIDATPASHSS